MSQPNTAELQANQAEMAPRGAVIEYKPDADVRMRDLCETLKGCQDQKLIVIHIQGGDSEGVEAH